MDAMMNWLKEFPLWQGEALGVDTLSARPDSVGVFSQGQQVLWEKQTVSGACLCRIRRRFLLRWQAAGREQAAKMLEAFEAWILENRHTAPVFGSDQTLRGENGHLLRTQNTTTGVYQLELIVEYTSKLEGE